MTKTVKGVSLVANPNIDKKDLQKTYIRYLVVLDSDPEMRAYKEIEMVLSNENQAALEALLAVALSQAESAEGI